MELGEHRQDEPPVPDCDCRRCAVATRDDLRKDAERYRWLRDKCNHVHVGVHIQFSSDERDADAAIDAAMKASDAEVPNG